MNKSSVVKSSSAECVFSCPNSFSPAKETKNYTYHNIFRDFNGRLRKTIGRSLSSSIDIGLGPKWNRKIGIGRFLKKLLCCNDFLPWNSWTNTPSSCWVMGRARCRRLSLVPTITPTTTHSLNNSTSWIVLARVTSNDWRLPSPMALSNYANEPLVPVDDFISAIPPVRS